MKHAHRLGFSSLILALLVSAECRPAMADEVILRAAGSLKAALTEVTQAFEKQSGHAVRLDFGPSGLLRERILSGEPTDVFASANMAHPEDIAVQRGGKVLPFATNMLCALVQPDIAVTPNTLLEQMLSADIRLGTSTPQADPSGDYAWMLFDKSDSLKPGAAAALKDKALTLTGGANSPKPPADRTVYSLVMERRDADIFLTYCTNAVLAAQEVPGLRIVQIPDALSVGATYGLLVLKERQPAIDLGNFITGSEGQAILAAYGFGMPPAK
ncbi:MAG: molybdate ABC transporter substrate-binding protein [Alphaproteobacteria bacterium]|nr:molybdate ABC transporter substrate-binding protein [Alphaproteobacteria bacterium]MBU0798172.1 molybdate ABC transporter substrate-binding protein [Alphaproteobacteria bacterium]MBU0887609.1 molybdate ABC transporter substrate-binding protein [Alphaproteobacteria bacterium]MBU1814261.1 molybdate ABC transporter substrate-binding protein [Alphaproteobacteria bacterium]MBU2091002.1 molybdate ABC transporter substrate-binding protein [Alphaproteobacteria bacterium]